MRVSTSHRFIYISTPKAGTHTICRILKDHFPKGLKENGLHNNRIPPCYHGFSRWTVVRNPFSRAASLWWSTCRLHPEDQYGARAGCGAEDDFPRFVRWLAALEPRGRRQQPLFLSQSDWLDPVQPIQTLHLEHLEEELQEMPWWREGIDLPELNTTTEKIERQSNTEGSRILRPTWQELCQEEEVQELIVEWAGRDFELFGYPTEVEL